MATQALINPNVLSWARIRSGLGEGVLARKVGVKTDKLIAWEMGKLKPTFRQAQNFAKHTNTPFGFLFLPKPPKESLPIPDLRTVDGAQVDEPSTELRDVVEQVLRKQAWYKEYLISHGREPLSFIGSCTTQTPIQTVVAQIREVLGVPVPVRGTWGEYQTELIRAAENAGILVMRSGIVGNNTHRKLHVSEFRGFAISDSIAPVVFINSSDAETARLFTLIHEIAHLWIGKSGISNGSHNQDVEDEVFCNAVAGEFLVPTDIFVGLWNHEIGLVQNLAPIATRFHVSKLVVARKALDSKLISKEEYREYYQSELDTFRNKGGGGGNFYLSAGAKNSSKLSSAVVSEALSGRLLLRDAGNLLGIAPHSIKTYARKLSL